jgi:hypothetical protein
MNLKILDEVGNPMNIMGAKLKAKLSREEGGVLEKGSHAFEGIDLEHGEVKLNLSEFDVSALKTGSHQTFEIEIQKNGSVKKAVFDGLTIIEKNGKKVIGE